MIQSHLAPLIKMKEDCLRNAWKAVVVAALIGSGALISLDAQTRKIVRRTPRVCSTQYPADLRPQKSSPANPDSMQARSVVLEGYTWNKSTLRVRFLNGTKTQRAKFTQHAGTWLRPEGKKMTDLASLSFEYVTSEPSDIRVSFLDAIHSDPTSWSKIGTVATSVPASAPTMHFGWFDSATTEMEYRRTILHEVGHALGLVHEHLHPKNGIQWNTAVVYADMAEAGWTPAEVDYNILNAFTETETQFTTFDPRSIMIYDIPAGWTKNGFSVTQPTRLSATDKDHIGVLYP